MTVGYAGTNHVWEFLCWITVVAIHKHKELIFVVGGGSPSPGGATGGGGGRVEYRQNVVLPSGEYTVHTGDAGAASTITHAGGGFS